MKIRGMLVAVLTFAISFVSLCLEPARTSGIVGGAWNVRVLSAPAAPGSSVPRVTAGTDGSVLLSWLEPFQHGTALRFSAFRTDHWSDIRTVAAGPRVLAAVSSEPAVVQLPDHILAAQWLTTAAQQDANDIDVAVSLDNGVTWSKPVVPYRNTTPGEHMYVSLFALPARGAGIIWLDPRDGARTQLIQTTIDSMGKLGPERVIDADVCSCCPTSSAISARGPLVLYRGHTRDDIRDIHVTSLVGHSWEPAIAVHRDNWKINGCPTNSGALSANRQSVAVAWFTGASGTGKVLAAFSRDAGRSFSEPITVDDQLPVGRASVALLADGSALVTWVGHSRVSHSSGHVALQARQIWADGRTGSPFEVARAGQNAKMGFPFVAPTPGGAIAVWTDWAGDQPVGVRAAVLGPAVHSPRRAPVPR